MATNDSTPRTVELQLSKGQVAIIDEQDADLASVKWCAQYNKCVDSYYAIRTVGERSNRTRLKLHNVIMERITSLPIPQGYEVDHINRNTLDNRRSNLRLATRTQNSRNKGLSKSNTSGYKGAVYRKTDKAWVANIRVDDCTLLLGYYSTAEEAAIAYNHAAKQYYGDFAYLNPIEGWEAIIPVRRRKTKTIGKYPDIEYYANKRKWRALFRKNGTRKSLGYFQTEEEAYAARCEAVKQYEKEHQ